MRFAVAFSSPKRSAKTIEIAAAQAKAVNAELVLLRIIPDPEKVGVIAQLISTDRPQDKARMQIDGMVKQLAEQGIAASGIVKLGRVASDIIKVALEIKADMLFVGTTSVGGRKLPFMKHDPIVHYLVDHCPISLCLVRHDINTASYPGTESAETAIAEVLADEGADSDE